MFRNSKEMKNILLIVDPQNDFITGTLPVEGAEEKMKKLAEYIDNIWDQYDYCLVTLDSHPEDHCSFVDNGGIWPKHCVVWTKGWEIYDAVEDALEKTKKWGSSCYHKGDTVNKEEYSIFDNEEDGYYLAQNLRRWIQEGEVFVDICGIAGDYCVLETLKGLRRIVPDECISILMDLTASIDGGEKLTAYAEENNINIITDSTLNLSEYVR